MGAGRRPSGTGAKSTGARGGSRAGTRPGAGGARTGVRPAAAVAGRPQRGGAGAGRPSRMLRFVVLGGVLAVLAVLLAPALRSYLAQQQQIGALREHVREQQATVTQLEKDRAAWNDPAYVKAQARDRLKFVMPGERAYTVIDPNPATGKAKASPVRAAADTARSDRSWFGDMWRSAQIAGSASAGAK